MMRAILVHGLGRTPASMLVLAARLRSRGLRPALFAYSATFETFSGCAERLRNFIVRKTGQAPFILVGHSLGTVLLRSVYPSLRNAPVACFFIAPPARACRAARALAGHRIYRFATGQMGQLLADPKFMNALPVPGCATRIYAGTGGPVGAHFPFGHERNDGILCVEETLIPGIPVTAVKKVHTFIMNAAVIADDIGKMAAAVDVRPVARP
jgi:hypothetical protein